MASLRKSTTTSNDHAEINTGKPQIQAHSYANRSG